MFVNDFSQTSYLYITSDQHVRGDKGIDKNVGTAPSVWVYPIVLLLFFFLKWRRISRKFHKHVWREF